MSKALARQAWGPTFESAERVQSAPKGWRWETEAKVSLSDGRPAGQSYSALNNKVESLSQQSERQGFSQRLSTDLHSQTPACVCTHFHEHSSLVSLEPGLRA